MVPPHLTSVRVTSGGGYTRPSTGAVGRCPAARALRACVYLSAAQKAELSEIVRAGPDPEVDRVVQSQIHGLQADVGLPPAGNVFTRDQIAGTWSRLPQRAAAAALVMPFADTQAMNEHLAEAKTVVPGAHAVIVLDGAGWHEQTPHRSTRLGLARQQTRHQTVTTTSSTATGTSSPKTKRPFKTLRDARFIL